MTPTSQHPERRQRQLANLKRGGTVAPIGNKRAVSHGGFAAVARERLEERERQVYEALTGDLPLREADGSAPAADAVVVSMFAQSICRLEDVKDYIARRGIETSRGHMRNAVEVEGRLRREALDFAEALGLTPRSRAKLGLDLVRGGDALKDAEAAREARERLDKRLEALDGEAEEEAK